MYNMTQKLILFPLLFVLAVPASAQVSSKSKSKDRFREKSDVYNRATIRNCADLNTPSTDYSPAFFQNGLVFVSSREKSGPRDKSTNETFSQLYFSPFDPNGEPAAPQKFSLNINSSLHEGPVSFSRDYKYMYFTRNNMRKGVSKADKKGVIRLKIYEAQDGFPDWTNERELPFNSDEYSCVHPSLSADGTMLFFASDMPGGYGGFDIYYVTRDGNRWGTPVNLGPTINSEKQEVFPFFSAAGTLYFSSNGHNTIGGLDIFYVNDPLNNPEEVVNLGEPFCSPDDDMGFIVNDEGRSGFFSSNRPKGYGKDDIYKFDIPRGIEGATKPKSSRAQIVVTDSKTGEPIQGAAVRVLQYSDDGFVNSNEEMYYIDIMPIQDKPNALSFQLVRKDADDMGTPDLLTNLDGQAQTEFYQYKMYMVLVSMNGYQTSERLISSENIEDGQSLQFNLKEAPFCHEAGGLVLTSEFGARVANATLRFVHKLTGQQERVRTTMRGEFDACLPYDGDYVVYVERDGFKPENFSFAASRTKKFYQEVRLRPDVATPTAAAAIPLASGMREGSVIVMDRIFYEYNKATLNQSAVRHFDALFDMLQRFPEMEIDLIAHTDTRGDAKLNLELTEERAKNAKTYLVYRGIAPERINPIGRGETEPRNRCTEGVECSDEEHQQNNRIEIRVRKMGTIERP